MELGRGTQVEPDTTCSLKVKSHYSVTHLSSDKDLDISQFTNTEERITNSGL